MTTKRNYNHLSADERDRLAVLRAEGKSLRQIARLLRRSPSSLSRELRRNCLTRRYFARSANLRSQSRRSRASRRPRLKSPSLRRYVEAKLRLHWSPELIAGRIRLRSPHLSVSHEAIYQWVYSDARHLIRFLPKRHKRRMRRGYVKGKHSRLHIPQRVPIAQRPASIDARSTVGHWEVDTVGNRKTRRALLVIHERKTRLTKLRLLQKRTAAELRKSLVRALRYLPPQLRRSLTFDNGYENSEHLLINESLGTHSYFCAPFHSWEKGSVENTISILRRIIPKSYNLRALSRRRLRRIEHWLNSRPKKCLAFRTPAEVFRPTHCKLRNAPLLSHHPAKQRRPTGGDRPAKE